MVGSDQRRVAAPQPLRARGDVLPPGPLTIAASGTSVVAARFLAETFEGLHPEIGIEVSGDTRSSATIRGVAEGRITLGLLMRALRDSDRARGLTVLPFVRTAIVFGTHPSVAEEGITADDLLQIYQGAKTRWHDGREIALLTREPGDSSIEVLEREIPGFRDAYRARRRPRHCTTLYTDEEMSRALAETPHALGMTDLGLVRAQRLPIKVLAFNGFAPTLASIRQGRYPLIKTLAFVFRKDAIPTQAAAFLDFARSAEGQGILRANGYLPPE